MIVARGCCPHHHSRQTLHQDLVQLLLLLTWPRSALLLLLPLLAQAQ
jgi:hypothetical protein